MRRLIQLLEKEIMEANVVVPYQKQLPAVLKPLETSVVKHIKQIEKVVENTSGNYMVSTQVTKIVDDLNVLENEIVVYEKTVKPQPVEEEDVKNKVSRYKEAIKRLKEKLSKFTKPNVKLPKVDLKDTLKSFYNVFTDILQSKAGQSLIAALAYTNPITAIVHDNWDIVDSIIGKGE